MRAFYRINDKVLNYSSGETLHFIDRNEEKKLTKCSVNECK